MTITTNYSLGDLVCLALDPQKLPRIIIEILIKPSGVEYCLSDGVENNWNYEIEFSKFPKTNNQ